MCGCNSSSGNPCCPTAQYFQEQVCGNFSGTLAAAPVWTADGVTDYVQATIEIFVAAGTLVENGVVITLANENTIALPEITAGNTIARSVSAPSSLSITADAGTVGRFCITLYKRLLP